ncbi:hypothetical protein EU545_02730 [Candidatus Thorarchaeota archaeon]|nr:MAG: hypothetical protein EU545_02730 [Candidatus Thorarchaeota archaeon]
MKQKNILFAALMLVFMIVELILLVPVFLQTSALLPNLNLSGLEELTLSIQFMGSVGVWVLAMNMGLGILWLILRPDSSTTGS